MVLKNTAVCLKSLFGQYSISLLGIGKYLKTCLWYWALSG